MKKSLKYFALAAVAMAAFASCNKVEAPETEPEVKPEAEVEVEYAPLTISASTETKTILRNDKYAYWVSTDILSVFDNDYNYYGFHNTSESAVKETVFQYDAWPSVKTPEFAVYCYTDGGSTPPSYDGTAVTAVLNANQTIYNKKSYAKNTGISVGDISFDGENYSVELMKNCYSLIKFSVKNPDILSIEVAGTNNEQLGGWVDIDYSKIKAIGEDDHSDPFWTGSEGKTQSKTIKLEVNASGAETYAGKKVFDKDSYYYLAVLPRIVAGLSFKVKKVDGTEDTQVINVPITLNRSKIKELSRPVDDDLFQSTPLSNIVLDCTDATKFKRMVGDKVQGLPVRPNYTESNFDFWLEDYPDYIFHGNVCYWSNSQHHMCFKTGTSVKLPNIEGYTLSELTITSQYSSKTPTYSVTDGTESLASVTIDADKTLIPATLDVSEYPQTTLSPDRYIKATGQEGNIKFTLTYEPVSE